ncbi:MAG: DUF1186 domain-containing protein [Alphaproteobacteria bacterium]
MSDAVNAEAAGAEPSRANGSPNVEAVLDVLRHSEPLPEDALGAALAAPDLFAPALVEAIERFIGDTEADAAEAQLVFFAFHVLAEMRWTAAFPTLARLLRIDRRRLDAVFGDAIGETASQVMLAAFGGDADPLRGVVEDENADGFARGAALAALAALAASGQLDREDEARYLEALASTLRAGPGDYAWAGWADAVALLGLDRLAPLVKTVLRDKMPVLEIGRALYDFGDFEYLSRQVKTADSIDAALARERLVPWTDTIGVFRTWYGFSEEYLRKKRETAAAPLVPDEEPSLDELDELERFLDAMEPAINPHRHTGRNDPCPCGSGKKFKACCLARP